MMYTRKVFWIRRDRCKYCCVESLERAESIKRALLEQAKANSIDISVTIKETEIKCLLPY